ncbi:MAG: mannose-6-phosphate isomerase [Clostridia bacterium]|nr:mannose-6-phosphate isomerase [Clostridia bacterium]
MSKIFQRNIIGEDVGEAWELSAHKNGLSIIANGQFKGKDIDSLFKDKELKAEIFGIDCEKLEQFPILAKFIDANQSLSIQVHPDDEYARKYENDSGKTEVWYIIEAKENAKLLYGFKGNVTKENLEEAVKNLEENVNYINVKKGDFIPIPAGTIHAIMDGIVLCEVQQSSDVTYRLYDWNRLGKDGKPRELHQKKAIDVIKLNPSEEIKNYSNVEKTTKVYRSNKFNINIVRINQQEEKISTKESFRAYIILEGTGKITTKTFEKTLKKGDTFLIPSNLGKYNVYGDLEMMEIWI